MHVVLAAKDDRHIDAAVVEHVRPVLHHPDARVLVDELILEVENVRIVGRYFHIHLEAALQAGRSGYTHTHTLTVHTYTDTVTATTRGSSRFAGRERFARPSKVRGHTSTLPHTLTLVNKYYPSAIASTNAYECGGRLQAVAL